MRLVQDNYNRQTIMTISDWETEAELKCLSRLGNIRSSLAEDKAVVREETGGMDNQISL